MNKPARILAITSSALLLVSTSSFANPYYNYKGENYKNEIPATEPAPAPCPPDRYLKDGIYLGIDAAYDAYRIRESNQAAIPALALHYNPAISATGWNAGAFLGYGQYFDWFYLAGELTANYSWADSHFTLTNTGPGVYTSHFDVRESYAASILPGVRLSDASLIYGRVGYIRTSIKTSETATTGVVATSVSNNPWLNGYIFGVGLETAVTCNISLRGEYDYSSYSSVTTALSTRLSPSNSQFTLGLIYHFA